MQNLAFFYIKLKENLFLHSFIHYYTSEFSLSIYLRAIYGGTKRQRKADDDEERYIATFIIMIITQNSQTKVKWMRQLDRNESTRWMWNNNNRDNCHLYERESEEERKNKQSNIELKIKMLNWNEEIDYNILNEWTFVASRSWHGSWWWWCSQCD
jgi:hypothetical protein